MPRPDGSRPRYSPWAHVAARAAQEPAEARGAGPPDAPERHRGAQGPRGHRRHRRRHDGADGPGHERWLVSYADFITLLFAVFATMYALSAVDAGKYAALAGSMQTAFGGVQQSDVPGDMALVVRPADAKVGFMPAAGTVIGVETLRQQLTGRLAPALTSKLVSLEDDPRGLVVSLREAGSFAVSSADLSDGARALLGDIGQALATIGNRVQVEGHTDDVPISTARFRSNWELSTARATAVVRFFVEAARIDPSRLSAAGYAEHHPRQANTTAEARARNRRVDIVIITPQADPAS